MNLGCGEVLLLFQTCGLTGTLHPLPGLVHPTETHQAVNFRRVRFPSMHRSSVEMEASTRLGKGSLWPRSEGAHTGFPVERSNSELGNGMHGCEGLGTPSSAGVTTAPHVQQGQ